MRSPLFFAAAVLLVPVLLLFQAIAALALGISEEKMIGERLLYSVRAEFEVLDDPDVSQYINDLGHKVLAVAGPQFFAYHFFVVKSDQFNAFAAPGGLVFFYTGLIKTMKDEDELVSVMAHEIGHVVSRHIARRMEKGSKINALTMGLGIAALALGQPELLVGSMAAGQAMNLHYSRQDEEEADRLSFGWMEKMHRNPAAMEEMLRTMRRIARYRSGELPQYLLTHPNPEARLGYVESLLEVEAGKKDREQYVKTSDFDFLRFKYRVLSRSMDFDQLRILCVNTITNGRSEEARTMARYGLALLAMQSHEYDRARDLLAQVRQHYPDREILGVDRAVLELEAGKAERALPLLEGAVRRNPDDNYAAFSLARCLIGLERFDRAEKILQDLAGNMPDYDQLWYEMARIRSALGRDDESRFFLGKYALYGGRVREAKQYLARAARNKTLPQEMRAEARQILDRLKELEENT